MRRCRKRQFPEAIFDRDFPYRGDAEIHGVCVFDRSSNKRSDLAVARDVPEKYVSIEQQPHCPKSRSTSSGSGSSKSSGTMNVPAASPNGRGCRRRGGGAASRRKKIAASAAPTTYTTKPK